MSIKKTLLISLGVTMVFYLAGSVAAASFDISQWSETIRGVIAFVWVMGLGMSVSLINHKK